MKHLLLLLSLFVLTSINAQPILRNIRTQEYLDMQRDMSKGWNTWFNNNILSFSYLPSGFSVNLGFKRVGNTEMLGSVIGHDPKTNRLGMRSNFGSYTSMEQIFSGVKYTIESASMNDELYICVTPEKKSMNQLVVEASLPWDIEGTIGVKDASLIGDVDGKLFKVSSVNEKLTNHYSCFTAPKLIYSLNEEDVCIYTGEVRKTRSEIKTVIANARLEQEKKINSYGELSEAFKAMQTVLSWNTIYDAANKRVISPVFRGWSVAWGGFVIFDWDNYFASYMLGLFNKGVAYANAIEITKAITPKGFVPNFQAPFYNVTFDRSQPPVGSMAISALYKKYGDKWLLEETYDELLSWNRWWSENRDIQGYLSWGCSDVTPSEQAAIKRSYEDYASEQGINPKSIYDNMGYTKPGRGPAALESGMDNSPAYDNIEFNEETQTLNMADVGLMGLYIADCNYLIEMAKILGKKDDVKELEKRRKKYTKSLSTLWSEEKGIFLNKHLDTGEFSETLTPMNFFPMLGKACTQKQAEIMMKKHYFNPDEFYGEYVIPSVSRNHPAFKDNDYWRGRIWAPLNFLVYKGMCNYDVEDARKDLVKRSMNLLMKNWKEHGGVCENYNALTGSGGIENASNSFYHWGALLCFMSFIEEGYMDN